MDDGKLRSVSMIIAAVAIIVAVCRFDWILAGVEVLFVVVSAYPYRKSGIYFNKAMILTGIITSVALIIVSLVYATGELNEYRYGDASWIYLAECLILPVLSFDIGFMVALIFDRYTESQFSKRWLIVFALVFALAVSGITMFTVGFSIWFDGMPFSKDEAHDDGSHYTDHILMIAPTCAIASSVVCAVVCKKLTKGRSMAEFLPEVA